ncbi:MAG: hypothetical protein K8W52_10855, partial [Deltaproteobacteria bacterium]|nr:hypothetical protein [Deltaproteobacteria bacterium]
AGDRSFTYDPAGNLLDELKAGRPSRRFVWDEGNLPTEVGVFVDDGDAVDEPADWQTTRYTYGDDGRRLKAVAPTGEITYTLFPEVEHNAFSQLSKVYFFGGRLVARADESGLRTYFHADRLSSTALVTDEVGQPVPSGAYDYAAFGERLAGAPGAAHDFLFTGARQDRATAAEAGGGLLELNARLYDPITARFISADTVTTGPGVLGHNRYAYASQNPLNRIDPTGHTDESVWARDQQTGQESCEGSCVLEDHEVARQDEAEFWSDFKNELRSNAREREWAISAQRDQITANWDAQRPLTRAERAERELFAREGVSHWNTYGLTDLLGETIGLAPVEAAAARFVGLGVVGVSTRASATVAEEGLEMVSPAALRWTQRTAGGNGRAAAIRESMATRGYVGDPIDVVRTADGIATVDHTRAAVALELGIKSIPARVHLPGDALPATMTGRFGSSTTWGQAVAFRVSRQKPPLPPTGTLTPPRLPKR